MHAGDDPWCMPRKKVGPDFLPQVAEPAGGAMVIEDERPVKVGVEEEGLA